MNEILLLLSLISLLFVVFCAYWMMQMLKLVKQSRIINSMTLKTILRYCESKGVDVDIQKIQKEVEDNV